MARKDPFLKENTAGFEHAQMTEKNGHFNLRRKFDRGLLRFFPPHEDHRRQIEHLRRPDDLNIRQPGHKKRPCSGKREHIAHQVGSVCAFYVDGIELFLAAEYIGFYM
jgi:hypothetical protein